MQYDKQRLTDTSTPGTFEVNNDRECDTGFLQGREDADLIQQKHRLVVLDRGPILQFLPCTTASPSRLTSCSWLHRILVEQMHQGDGSSMSNLLF